MTRISRDVWFRIADISARGTFAFNADEPLDVTLTFEASDGPVVWRFARQLLVDGLNGVTGLGDVSCGRDGWRFFVYLSSPDGRATLWCTAADVDFFVTQMERTVPLTGAVLDFDAELELLLMTGDTR